MRSCTRRGPAIDLVLSRARENRSQFVIAQARGREMIFWQSPRTAKQARPAVRIPTARAHGQVLDIVIDTAEKYPYTFSGQQTSTSRRRLPAGDYAVLIGEQVVAAVERKTLEDLAGSLLSGRLTYALAELTALPRAAVVVEDRYSRLFKLEHAPGAGPRRPSPRRRPGSRPCPIVFCETRPLAQEWTYRWLGACLSELTAAAGQRGPGEHLRPCRADRARSPAQPAAEVAAGIRLRGGPGLGGRCGLRGERPGPDSGHSAAGLPREPATGGLRRACRVPSSVELGALGQHAPVHQLVGQVFRRHVVDHRE